MKTEFIIFKWGENTTSKGTFIYNEFSEATIKADDAKWGNDYCLDYEHQQVNPSLKGAVPAAGWFNLDFRPTGLWATNVRYTDEAFELIKTKCYRYTSPTFSADKDGIITSLFNVSLVNIPATDKLPALVAAKKLGAIRKMTIDLPEELVAKLTELAGGEDKVAQWVVDLITAELAEPADQPVAMTKDENVVATSKVEYLHLLAAKDKVEALSKEVVQLKTQLDKRDREEVMGRLKANGKITPSMSNFINTLSTAQLVEFEKSSPKLLLREIVPVAETETFEGKPLSELSPVERVSLALKNPELSAKVEQLRANKSAK